MAIGPEVESAESTSQTPAGAVDKSNARVRGMFGSIARRYDLLNHLLSLNIDKSWRDVTAKKLAPFAAGAALDCCAGTGDLAIALARRLPADAQVVSADFCRPMLEIHARKVRAERADAPIKIVEADLQRLPFPDDRFGVVTVAFGLRNVADTARGLGEMIRVARRGGRVAVLEFSKPTNPLLGRVYGAFFRHVLPRVGQAVAPNDYGAYEYLPESVQTFPEGRAMLEFMSAQGLREVTATPLTFGVATLYVGVKPDSEARP